MLLVNVGQLALLVLAAILSGNTSFTLSSNDPDSQLLGSAKVGEVLFASSELPLAVMLR